MRPRPGSAAGKPLGARSPARPAPGASHPLPGRSSSDGAPAGTAVAGAVSPRRRVPGTAMLVTQPSPSQPMASLRSVPLLVCGRQVPYFLLDPCKPSAEPCVTLPVHSQ